MRLNAPVLKYISSGIATFPTVNFKGSASIFHQQCDSDPVHKELQSYQRGYLNKRGGGRRGRGGGRYDTLPGLKPRHPAPVTNERSMKRKHNDGGGRENKSKSCRPLCVCVLQASLTQLVEFSPCDDRGAPGATGFTSKTEEA